MKKISYLLLLLLAFVYAGCADTEQPYVGYVIIERAVVEAEASSTTTITADTDIDSPIEIKSIDFGEGVDEWCTITTKGKEITVTTTSYGDCQCEMWLLVEVIPSAAEICRTGIPAI